MARPVNLRGYNKFQTEDLEHMTEQANPDSDLWRIRATSKGSMLVSEVGEHDAYDLGDNYLKSRGLEAKDVSWKYLYDMYTTLLEQVKTGGPRTVAW